MSKCLLPYKSELIMSSANIVLIGELHWKSLPPSEQRMALSFRPHVGSIQRIQYCSGRYRYVGAWCQLVTSTKDYIAISIRSFE
jgi:hypothetical protein